MMGSAVNNTPELAAVNKEEGSERSNDEEIEDLEWTPDQEILLLYSLHGLKPVGPHKHFRMILIQERFSNAMNKHIPTAVIWKKLNSWYDLEALDEAEAEADAASAVEVEFELPAEDFGELMEQKQKGIPIAIPRQSLEIETEENPESHIESDASSQDNKIVSSDGESSKESDSSKGVISSKFTGKEIPKRGSKRTSTPVKDNATPKKDISKETGKRDINLKEESKKGQVKEEDKKEASKKVTLDPKKDERKDDGSKTNKRGSTGKKVQDQKEEGETKKLDHKKSVDTPKSQRETSKQLRTDTSKRGEAKVGRSETPKQKLDLKKETDSEKKKELEKKNEQKSPEKTPESTRGGKLRARKDVNSEKPETPAGTKRTKESASKATEPAADEPAKKGKTPAVKGRPTRNSLEPQKPASPASSPVKRRTRVL